MQPEKILILGAAGRDFHNFNMFFRDNAAYEVVGFTATQIPNIAGRTYPQVLAGKLYPNGLPIFQEDDLEKIITENQVDRVVFAYSDVTYDHVMHLAARTMAAGADFTVMGTRRTMLESKKPVIAVCAVRTGCGKSQTSRYIGNILRQAGKKVVVVRHPMPYGDLAKQRVQRFATYEDLAKFECTIEEREEYESHVKNGMVVYAGVDYEAILREAEKEADVVIWDGGNNDTPFFKPDLWITVADPLRPGHELSFFPGETNFRAADIIVINKANTASAEGVETVVANAKRYNPKATVIKGASEVVAEKPELIKGKKVLVVEDGPTITHGGMPFGAGKVAAEKYGAAELIDGRPFAVGSIKETYEKFPHIGTLLPAMGYYPEQVKELEDTINASNAEVVLIGTPFDLARLIKINKPTVFVDYALVDMDGPTLAKSMADFLSRIS
ncbi:MAG TPA: GTPase [Myxococcales bacterium]|jgi:predicted GTPase|nr:GTPase [Myxococcales bacterium]